MNLLDNSSGALVKANCLEFLERMPGESVDLFYLDPNWNLNNSVSIKYNGAELDSEDYLFFIVQQAYRILKTSGNLIIHSLPERNFNFQNLIIPIFGEDNCLGEYILPMKRNSIARTFFNHNHETLIRYGKTEEVKFFPFRELSKDEIKKLYPYAEDGRNFRLDPLIKSKNPRSNFNQFEWKGIKLPKDIQWRFSEESLDTLFEENKIYIPSDSKFPRLKVYSEDRKVLLDSVWDDIRVYSGRQGTFGEKSEEFFMRILNLVTEVNDVVLEPFAGSGNFGNVSISKGRKWIGIEENFSELDAIKETDIRLVENAAVNSLPIIWDQYESRKINEEEEAISQFLIGETDKVEFKEAYNYDHFNKSKNVELPNQVMKEIAAFLNSNSGGVIYLGVHDSGNIIGLENDFRIFGSEKYSDKFGLALTSKIRKTFGGTAVDLITFNFLTIEEKVICKVKVLPAEKPIFINGDYCVRDGTQSTILKAEEFYHLMQKRELLRK